MTISVGTTINWKSSAFAAMSSTKAKDYDAIKATVLARYDINKETYHQRFRSATKQ